MGSVVEIADGFDRIDDENKRDIERALKKGVQSAATTYGVDDWRTVGVAVGAGLLEASYNFLAMMGRGLVDVLRLGETLRKPSAGAVVRDALRILTIVPIARVLKTGTMMLGVRAAAGGPMSCVVTGNTVAARMSGTRLFITLDELWQSAWRAGPVESGLSAGVSPVSSTFPGLSNMRAMVPGLKSLGAAVEDVNVISIDDVATVARQGRGPVAFGVTWWRAVNGVVAPAGRHMMVAYRGILGEVMIADQGGVRTLSEFMRTLSPGVSFGVEGGYLVEYASWMTDIEAIQRSLQLGRGIPLALRTASSTGPAFQPSIAQSDPAAESLWFASRLQMPLYHIPGPVALQLDTQLRRALHRPTRPPRVASHAKAKPPLWDDPNLEGAEPKVRRAWQAFLALRGSENSVTAADLQRASGLGKVDFDAAMMMLEYLYRRVHLSYPVVRAEGDRGPLVVWTYR